MTQLRYLGHELDPNTTFSVPTKSVKTALNSLNPQKAEQRLKNTACKCRLGCSSDENRPDILSVLRDRESFLCAPDGTAHLSVVLRSSTTLSRRGTSYLYKGKFCCRNMFKAIYLIGNDRLTKITKLNQTNSTAFQRRKSITNSESIDAIVKLDRTIVFWRGYFDDHCQKPNDDM
jgi:hypothetical protein